jgi:hypothetical protein
MTRTTTHGSRINYQLTAPWKIGSNLEPAVELPDGSEIGLWVDPQLRNDEGRLVYGYEIRDAGHKTIASGNDIHSGVGAEPDLDSTLSSLLSFAQADAERASAIERGDYVGDPLSEQDKALGQWYFDHEPDLWQFQDLYKNQMQDDEEFSRIGSGLDITGQVQPTYTDAEIATAATVTDWSTMDPDGTVRPLTMAELADFTEKVKASEALSDAAHDEPDTVYFAEPDGHGEPTLWRHTDSPGDPEWEPEDPHPVVRRSDINDPDLNWDVIVDRVTTKPVSLAARLNSPRLPGRGR